MKRIVLSRRQAVSGLLMGTAAGFANKVWLPRAAWADEAYPTKPITVFVEVELGGATDVTIRAIAEPFQQELGQELRYDYRPGADGLIAWNALWPAPRDGYSILGSVISTSMLNLALQPQGFEIGKDVTYIASINQDPTCIITKADSPYKSIQEVIEMAHKAPVNVSLSRWTQPANIPLQAMNRELGTQFAGVPYQGGGKARAALIQGEVPFSAGPLNGALSLGDQARVLALFDTENRFQKYIGDVPLINDVTGLKLPPFSVQVGFAVHTEFVEKYPERVARFTEALRKAFASPALAKGIEAAGLPPENFNLWDNQRCAQYINEFQPVVEAYKDIMKEG
jgi:tripartite-type tricarboxylate transporter receptor subunit TctC